jgi:hypothetical protein
MGMYTACKFNGYVKIETKAIEILDALINQQEDYFGFVGDNRPKIRDNHEFFDCERTTLIPYDTNFYFDNECTKFDPVTGELQLRSAIKNYDNEYQKFFNWIAPYLDQEKSDIEVVLDSETEYGTTLITLQIFENSTCTSF